MTFTLMLPVTYNARKCLGKKQKDVISIRERKDRISMLGGVCLCVFIQLPMHSSIPGAGRTERDRTRAPASVGISLSLLSAYLGLTSWLHELENKQRVN